MTSDNVMFVVGLLVLLLTLAGVAVAVWLNERSNRLSEREQLRQAQFEADARIQQVTYAALHRMYEAVRQPGSGGSSGSGQWP